MARFVPDIMSHRWVIISPQRLSRPNGEKHSQKTCPFCEGNEKKTPPEIMRYGNGEKDTPGWQVRVIPNKYPITDFHDVIIHAPKGEDNLGKLPVENVTLILQAYKSRYNFYKKQGQVLIFSNHGIDAGASLKHPHSQLVVLPFQINIDALTREPQSNIVSEKKNFVAYCPDFSQWPYELWIVTKKLGTVFGDITDEEIDELAPYLQWGVRKLEKIYKSHEITDLPFSYNYYIYPKENWYIRIIPRFVSRAGFELGTGLSVNIVDPHEAAETFRKGEK
jgi:UDPglucose--hexose-1-phosphate uridylyltransferase